MRQIVSLVMALVLTLPFVVKGSFANMMYMVIAPEVASAQTSAQAPVNSSGQSAQSKSASQAEFEATLKQLRNQAGSDLNPAGIRSGADIIGVMIRALLSIIGSLALVLYIYGGILWMTSRGNSEKTAAAGAIIQWTTLGVIVMLASYLLVTQLIKIVGGNI